MSKNVKVITEGKDLERCREAVLDLIKNLEQNIERVEITFSDPVSFKHIYDAIQARISAIPGVKLEPVSGVFEKKYRLAPNTSTPVERTKVTPNVAPTKSRSVQEPIKGRG